MSSAPPSSDKAEIAALLSQLHHVQATLEDQYRQRRDLEAELDNLKQEHAQVQAHLQAIISSRSYRVLAPLRWLRAR